MRRAGRRRLAVASGTGAVVVAADQITKSVALAHLHGPVHVLGPFGLNLTFNSGVAFSLFSGASGVIIAAAAAVVALLVVVTWRSQSAAMSVGLGMVLGGAIGNLSDRAFRGHHGSVVDFVTLTHWPTFNVADASITLGAVLIAALVLFQRPPAPA
ncbi:MAG: signal peptidase II [Acidimicrobiales bacterium]